MKTLLPILALCLSCVISIAQNRLPAFEMNGKLGRGINMGNSFEAPTETEWGNPWKPEYFKIMAQLGFKHVRLPVRWEPADRSMETFPYTINPIFLNRIQQVVDTAIRYNLRIIINMHHHDALYENPVQQKDRFLSQWGQIANYFKNFSDKLLFEVLNEPHGNVTPQVWNEYFSAALTEIRKTNPTRVVLLGVAEYGGLGAINQLQLPNDEYIILSPHYYNPFHFTHQGADWVDGANAWLGTTWNDTESDRETVASEFSYALQFSSTNHIPIHVGEFGAFSTADIESRERWTTFLARWFEEHNLSWAYWEFSAGFGIYNPTSKVFNTPLVDALQHNEMPEAAPVLTVPVYTSNFSSGTDGWAISNQGGASSTLAATSGKLNVSITNGGTETWHVQIAKNGIAFEKNKSYKVSFKAQAAAGRSATFYAGKASNPWNAYSGYNGINITTIESVFTFTFAMTDPTDLSSRLVFDLGKNLSAVTVTEIKVEEVVPLVTRVEATKTQVKVVGYPNPVKSKLFIEGLDKYHFGELHDLTGRLQARFSIDASTTSLGLENISPGLYVLTLTGSGRVDNLKIMKE